MLFMSKIVNENYIDKLNSILEDFDFSDKLKSLIDFFDQQFIIDESRKRNQKVFSVKVFNFSQQLEEFSDVRRILAYIYKLINSFEGKYLQIHLNIDIEDSVSNQIIFLFIWESLINSSFDKEQLKNDIEALKSEIKRDLILPSDNNKHQVNQILRESKGIKFRRDYFEKILNLTNNEIDYGCGWLINTNKKTSTSFNFSEYLDIPNSINSYLNFGDKLQGIYDNNNSVLSRIDTIINLFPAITGSNIWYQDFIAESINEWNRLDEFNFKKVITITSGKKSSESLSDMLKQNKFQAEEIYTIYSFELDYKDYEN